MSLTIQDLWALLQPKPFTPNLSQEQAILHTGSPLFLTAGPGSGKTRVLLWRTLNLLVFHQVKPEEIFLSTFTEKAAFQLQEGLRSLLGLATNLTGTPYDISRMYVGTVHSLCQKLIKDRRLAISGKRPTVPALKDELGQYFYISRRSYWENALQAVGYDLDTANEAINQFFGETTTSKHIAVTNCISLFNRFSEESLNPAQIKELAQDDRLKQLIDLYAHYKHTLTHTNPPLADFSLIQQEAFNVLQQSPNAGNIFKHIIIDEYQDTNTIQERIFFKLAEGHQNICVVGDDDQALYRFRGATVENFVEFPNRCKDYLGCDAQEIPLNTNYRSRQQIVTFYTDFITRQNWKKDTGSGSYRVDTKNIQPHSQDSQTSIIASTPDDPQDVCSEIACFVKNLIDTGKVQDPNQIAFLYPSLQYRGTTNKQVERMKTALEKLGLKVYAPRASKFLAVDEAVAVFGIYLLIFGKPTKGEFHGQDYNDFHKWMDKCQEVGNALAQEDRALAAFITEKKQEIATALKDYEILSALINQNRWSLNQPYDMATMKRPLSSAKGLSDTARKNLSSSYLDRIIKNRIQEGNPFTLSYILNAATSLDWSVLDLFYRLCIFQHFKAMFDLAETGTDEGPICNMGLISQYLARFTDEYTNIITAQFLNENKFQTTFFMGFLYSLFRLGETEYEDANDPFPKGRIPFLTIHQSKGLEFPVVVLGNPRKEPRIQRIEEIVRPLLDREGEPLERMAEFDVMRMFYVALSRAKNLLVIAHFKGKGQKVTPPFDDMLASPNLTRIPDFDIDTLPPAQEELDDLPRNYSYTTDYLLYQRCPRQYMIFRKYGFVASRSQTMFFGSVVHKTIEDLHYLLIAQRNTNKMTDTEIEQQIDRLFNENYELMRLEGGHALSADVKRAALLQVIYYWRKMRDVAENVTETEVKLNLPEQITPQGRKYGIEGVVDIIRENDQTIMYDIKTHDADYVRANTNEYEKQLNVYAHIWQGLRRQELDQTCIIATSLPVGLREAEKSKDQNRIAKELANWDPLIEIPFNQDSVEETITEFGAVVDAIESRQFQPPSVERLKMLMPGKKTSFAVQVCRNCDARFSCSTYRNYVEASASTADTVLKRFLGDYGSDADREDWIYSNLEATPEISL